jgi:PadR family transcriptional regulator PadR
MQPRTGAEVPHDPQLLKGVLSLVLLRLLAEQESYGYQLVTRIHEIGLTGVAEGTVYPALARLERERQVTSRLVPSSAGPARKYYRLTPHGYDALVTAQATWEGLAGVVATLLSRPVPTEPVPAQQAPAKEN